jgi:hypothetical protein
VEGEVVANAKAQEANHICSASFLFHTSSKQLGCLIEKQGLQMCDATPMLSVTSLVP